MFCEIINIGDEILIGQIINTNATWMAQTLNKHGIKVNKIAVIGDNQIAIEKALDDSLKTTDLVILTGGLGPTKDDITKHVLAKYFGTTLVENTDVLDRLKTWYAKRGRALNDLNKTQALLPKDCFLLENPLGSACGMLFEKGGKWVVSLPGVPYEMKAIFPELLDRISKSFTLPTITHLTVMTAGIVESELAKIIADWEEALPPTIKLAYLPKAGIVRLRLSAFGTAKISYEEEVKAQANNLIKLIPKYHYGYQDQDFHQAIGELLVNNKQTVVTAESCTGGLIAQHFTQNSGASAYYKGSVIAYDNSLKINQLDVPSEIIALNGAVSQEVALAMAIGAQTKLSANFAIAVTGIAGPMGGSIEKPIGTVWIAIAGPKGNIARKYNFGENRALVIERAAMQASYLLWRYLKHQFYGLKLNGLD